MITDLLNCLPETLIDQLHATPQNPKYHPEGSVYQHILEVANHLPQTIDYQLCALFHDMGKIDALTVVEFPNEIKLRSINHELYLKNYFKYAECFDDPYINWEMIWEVCVWHMRMHQYMDGSLKKEGKRKVVENLKYFNELKVFHEADTFRDPKHQGLPILVLTVGIPGSGKSTWAKAFATRSGYMRICPDDIREKITGNISDISCDDRVWNEVYHQVGSAISNGSNVILDATMVNSKARRVMISQFEDIAIIVFKLFPCDPEEAKERIRIDIGGQVNRSNVPASVVDRMYENWINSQEFFKNNKLVIKEKV